MSRAANIWIGITIGFLAGLLVTTLLILLVPRLRPLVGLEVTYQNMTQTNQTRDGQSQTNTQTETTTETEPESVQTESENIAVFEPAPHAQVGNPFSVRGSARVFENSVSIRLKDGDGSVLAETFATANSPDIGLFGPFELSLTYKTPRFATGTLEVFQESARDGSEVDKVTIPIEFGN